MFRLLVIFVLGAVLVYPCTPHSSLVAILTGLEVRSGGLLHPSVNVEHPNFHTVPGALRTNLQHDSFYRHGREGSFRNPDARFLCKGATNAAFIASIDIPSMLYI
jgi:hypothetical protein